MLQIKKNIPLAQFSTFRIGGKADFYVTAITPQEVAEAVEYAEQQKMPLYILGGGSNVLFSDKGFRGLIIHINDGSIHIDGPRVSAGAGAILHEVVQKAAAANLAGLERLAGIPGSFGGGVRGNAGAFSMEIGDRVVLVKIYDKHSSLVREFSHDECQFTYRSSIFKLQPHLLIISAELRLEPGNQIELEKIIKETIAQREAKHPQDALCAGSFFMNPVVEDNHLREEFEKDNLTSLRGDKLPAGWLIDHVGLRGAQIGGAMVSMRHPNYILNTGNAKAEDIIMLASMVKMRVRDQLGVQLKEEVQLVGF